MKLQKCLATGLSGAVVFGPCAISAFAQSGGDYDGDGDVDAADFWFWTGCMTGPGGENADPACAAFDFDGGPMRSTTVDLADFATFGRVFDTLKVPLGGAVSCSSGGRRFKVYVPTKWGGVLAVVATQGTISELKYPSGAPFANGTETGENQHGWYTFRVTGALSYTVSTTFVQTGQAAVRPWDFYWWAKKGDYIHEPWSGGDGVAETTAQATDEQVIPPGYSAGPGADIVRCSIDGTLETTPAGDDQRENLYNLFDRVNPYRPLDKYDQLHGGYPRSWEAQNDPGTEDWEGHCLGGAMASILKNQPTPATGTPYNQEEVEGLWCELGENGDPGAYGYKPGHWVTGDPANPDGIPPGPPAPGFDTTDEWISLLHARFEECIRHEQVPLASNLRAAAGTDPDQVWNHAIYEYSASYVEAPGGNEHMVYIVNDLTANSDRPPPTGNVIDRTFTYTYEVEYSAGQVIPGAGDFISVEGQAQFAPQAVFHVVSGVWQAHNPWVNVADVMADDGSN